ncbi:bifunctional cytochrome P450/NADPH--P450 reductase [Streptomyces albipurpureus]|uniref:Bifunctional cytochrome P450/NADPH--P450 reductase n=1 Tax=Streptomyces albipurpureus TaxID=2897419 RepID=A0ABT0UN24_9ACTN|nr:cytochrome P450 [Streptomyces sp. CWNU-1]MCM2389020.1 cytochrome P450 [Streptomyces sp. CWNU-1]
MNSTSLRQQANAVAIPERGAIPLVGHALRVPTDAFTQFAMAEARALGPIYRLRFLGRETLMVSGADLVAELCDETRFRKSVDDLMTVREFGGDGLFTALGHEPNWRKAHNILMPAFSFNALRAYHPTMVFAAKRLLAKWDSHAGGPVDVAGDMTQLTLDTIGLCGFGYDFDCFGRSEQHPFIATMLRVLAHAQKKTGYLPGLDFLYANAENRQRADITAMNELVDDIVRRRRTELALPQPSAAAEKSAQKSAQESAYESVFGWSGSEPGHEPASGSGPGSAYESTEGSAGPVGSEPEDLLSLMLHAKDKDTGEPLDDTNIRYQVITFLIAGHETTSGALSFALYYLLKHPEVLAAAQAETDTLWGDNPDPDPSYEDIGRLRYLRQVLNEALRLWPTAPAFSLEPLEDTHIGGRYPLLRGQTAVVLTPMLHRDPGWGDNPELFNPGRFTPEQMESRPAHLYKPFGNGERSCIGRQFALHEATLLLGLIVHRYRLLDHSDYQLKIKETLTLKPDRFSLTPVRRARTERRPAVTATTGPAFTTAPPLPTGLRAPGTTLTVLYGSNLGTCRSLAGELAERGTRYGFTTTVAKLDDAVGTLDPEQPVLIVAASYNGRPTDDAARFVDWLETTDAAELPAVPYAVLGVGDRNWPATYQRIPTLIDERLAAAGGNPLVPRAAVDVSGDVAAETDRWGDQVWAELLDCYGLPVEMDDTPPGTRYTIEVMAAAEGPLPGTEGMHPLLVTETAELCDMEHPLGRSKRFLRLRLPEGMTYRSGDHLLIRPTNPASLVHRTERLLGLDPDRMIQLTAPATRDLPLPLDQPMSVRALLTHFVELGQPATTRQIRALAALTPCPPERIGLEYLPEGSTATLPDLLERFASCRPTLPELLDVLAPMRVRYYSISSSPAQVPDTVDLMVAASPMPHRGGEGTWLGAGAAYLAGLGPGDVVDGRVTSCQESFRLPADPTIPVIVISAGTGLAPFRAAIADRALPTSASPPTSDTAPGAHPLDRAPLLCYFGCDHPDVDYLYRDELEAAERTGTVSLRPVHSQAPEEGMRFVQDRIAQDSAEVWALLQAGAHIRVCGDGRAMAPAVRDAFRSIHRDRTGATAEDTETWLTDLMKQDRYVEDVWTG